MPRATGVRGQIFGAAWWLDKVPLVPKMRCFAHAIFQRSCIPTFEALAVACISRGRRGTNKRQ